MITTTAPIASATHLLHFPNYSILATVAVMGLLARITIKLINHKTTHLNPKEYSTNSSVHPISTTLMAAVTDTPKSLMQVALLEVIGKYFLVRLRPAVVVVTIATHNPSRIIIIHYQGIQVPVLAHFVVGMFIESKAATGIIALRVVVFVEDFHMVPW